MPGEGPKTPRGYPVNTRDVTTLCDQTPKAYCPLKLSENATYRLRKCKTSTEFWLLRFLVDASLLLSYLANFDSRTKTDALVLANLKGEENQHYYEEQASQSWNHLSRLIAENQEDALLLLHWGLDSLASAAPLPGDYSHLDSLPKREQWEQWVLSAMAGLTNPASAQVKLRELKQLLQRQATPEQKQVFEAITETVDPALALVDTDYRSQNLPALWRMRTAVSVADFKQRFLAHSQAAAHPVTSLLVQEEELLRCIASLPEILAWKAAVEQQFNKRIDKETAQSRSVGQVLQDLTPEMRREWTLLFKRFTHGWNLARDYIRQYVISEGIRLVEMNERMPLVYSLNMMAGEGAQGIALVKWLVKQHNDAIFRLHRTLLESLEAEPAKDPAIDAAEAADQAYREKLQRFGQVPLHLVRPRHMVQPFPSHGPIEYVLHLSAQRSYIYGKGKQTAYDYSRVEEFLFSECVHGRPLINSDPSQLRMVSFLNDVGLSSLLKQIQQTVEQSKLPEDVKEDIKKELGGPELAQRCLRACEMCMNFIRNSGGNPDQSLVKYAEEVLLIRHRDESSGLHFDFLDDTHGEPRVCLRHISDLWKLLHGLVYPDPLSGVAAKYRQKMPTKLNGRFKKYCQALSKKARKALLDTMDAFVKTNLDEDSIKPEAGLKADYFQKLLTNNDWRFDMEPLELSEMNEFSRHMDQFPNELYVQHCIDAMRVVQQLVNA